MAKKIRFPLRMAGGVEVKDLEQLKEHFDLQSVVEHYKSGKLLNWLEARYLEGEADAVRALDEAAPDFQRRLCEVFQVEYTGDEVDLEAVALRQERLKRLRSITDEAEYIDNIDRVAFDQEELADLLDEGETTIYLCGEAFSVPVSRKGVTYVGIQDPTVHISGKIPVNLDDLGFDFRGIVCDDLPAMPDQESEETPSDSYALDQKLAVLFKKMSRCNCMAITENYLLFEKVGYGSSWFSPLGSQRGENGEETLDKGKYCLNLRTLEVKAIPDYLYIPARPVIAGDRLIYHLGGADQVKYFDAAAMENGCLIDCDRSQYLDASPDYVLAGMWNESKLLEVKTGEVYHLNETYGKILEGHVYTFHLNENRVYNPVTKTTSVAKGVTWDFRPEKVCGSKMYGTIHGVVSERDVKVMDRTTGSKRQLLKYFHYSQCDSRVSISDGYWVIADQKDYYKDPIVIRAIELETSEVRKIASLPPTCGSDVIGVIDNFFYYRTRERVTTADGKIEEKWQLYKVSLANPEQCEEII